MKAPKINGNYPSIITLPTKTKHKKEEEKALI